ncbi:putative Carboxypeptidase [Seiridium cardinale]
MPPLSSHIIALAALWQGATGLPIPRGSEDLSLPTSDQNLGVSIPSKSRSANERQTHICETTSGVKSYSGYVNLPADSTEGRAYDIHTFFWFFESRKDPANAPLSLWLQRGPGSPSMTAALGENGPSKVASNSKDAVLNPWSWSKEVKMLYIDQPVQVGFSCDTLINGTVNEVLSPLGVTEQESLATLDLSKTYIGSTFSYGNPLSTANTTKTAALAAWHFMQTWMTQFPHYQPKDNKFTIWTESYGGHDGPTFSSFFESRTLRSQAATSSPLCRCTRYRDADALLSRVCLQQYLRHPGHQQDSGNQFDVANSAIDPFPPKYAAGFLNSREVQDDFGVPLNFTGFSDGVNTAFTNTGDFVLGCNVAILGELLDRGVKVSMMYGDRDFQCNCLGGEQVSFAIESDTRADFHKSKYTKIKTDDSYTGDMVRQFGSLSFSRVFNVGHEVPWYQPETTYRIFQRAMFNKYVATGTTSTKARGVPLPPKPECYFWDMVETCTKEQKLLFQSGTAITEDFILVGYEVANGTDVYF